MHVSADLRFQISEKAADVIIAATLRDENTMVVQGEAQWAPTEH
jgi:hypothetical protein